MTPTTQQILTAMANQLNTAMPDVPSFAGMRDNFNAPAAFCWTREVRYHGAMAQGDVEHDVVVAVLIPRPSDTSAMDAMHSFMSYSGSLSIRAALEGDVTLGGVVDDLVCVDGRPGAIVTIGSAEYLRLDFNVTVYP